jgi:hypothetical protein
MQLDSVACELCGEYHPPELHVRANNPIDISGPETTTPVKRAPLRPFTTIGYSVADEVLCSSCLSTTPITGEKVSHTCRSGRQQIPDRVRREILRLEKAKTSPGKIAKHFRITLATVMRVISGDADDDTTCPACQAGAHHDLGQAIPLYFADRELHAELCTYCGRKLVDLAVQRDEARTSDYRVEHLVDRRGRPALRFDRKPPEHVLTALKAAGWRYTDARLWVDFDRRAEVPSNVLSRLPPKPKTVTARPPTIRRRSTATA